MVLSWRGRSCADPANSADFADYERGILSWCHFPRYEAAVSAFSSKGSRAMLLSRGDDATFVELRPQACRSRAVPAMPANDQTLRVLAIDILYADSRMMQGKNRENKLLATYGGSAIVSYRIARSLAGGGMPPASGRSVSARSGLVTRRKAGKAGPTCLTCVAAIGIIQRTT